MSTHKIINEEQAQAKALAERTVELDRVWRNSLDVLVVADANGVFRAISPAWTRVLGHDVSEVIGRSFCDFVFEDDAEKISRAIASAARVVDINGFENRYRHKDGSPRTLAWRTSAENGMIYGYARDVTTERAQAMELAQRVIERERLWSTNPMLFARAAYDSTILEVNPAWATLLGWTPEDLVGHSYSKFVHPDDAERSLDWARRLASGLKVEELQNRYLCKNGDTRWIAWAITADDDIFHCVGRDVTEQRAQAEAVIGLEANLRQSQKMEAVGQLTGGLAHDFNNMLQGITGSLAVVQKRIALGRTDDLDRFIASAVASAVHAGALIHRLLAFSRRQPLDPRPIQSNLLVASMEDLLRRTLGETIELKTMLNDELWLTLSDANQLESAILNLAINARDAMPDGGGLTIETSNTTLPGVDAMRIQDVIPGEYVCICVSDTGSGMSPKVVERAFEPFFTTKPIGQGTGLGLSMIYGFTRQSNGYCLIESAIGQGTRVKVFLPRHRGDAVQPAVALSFSESPAGEHGEVVVVVEDEPVVRNLIVEVVTELGYRALEAHDGISGLSFLSSTDRVDLLITDIGLPGMNGRQLADAARASRPGLKVLFITGYAENATVADGFLEPGMALLTKPFSMESLAVRIRQLIEGK